MSVTVRPARREDLPQLLKLLAELPVTTGEGEMFELDEARSRPVLDRILAQDGRMLVVAEDGGVLVGTLDLVIVPNLTHDASPWAMIENVQVDEGRRREGVGKLIVEDAIRRAREAGCYKVQLLSFKQRREAHEFYRALGFEPLAEGFRMYF